MTEHNIKDLLKLYEEGKATEEQRRLVDAYLAHHQQQSPKRKPDEKPGEDLLQEIMEKIRLAREQASKEAPVYAMDEIDYPMDEAEEERGGGRRKRIAWMAAASIALLITAGLVWRQSSPKTNPPTIAMTFKTIQAAPGKTIHLLLSDSSEVWLNAGAVLRYPQHFDDKLRKVELLDGEAFFQVHTDANRGFVVQADQLVTKVLGTSFDIKAYRETQQMSVTVTSGKVAVSARRTDKETILTANQEARYYPATGLLKNSAAASVKTVSWKNGTFNFVEENLGDIAIELEHYFNVHIQFKYPGMKKYSISASFRHSTPLKDMLAALCLLNQNHFIQIDDQHYVIR
jgi:transmembrane sensor